jgi:PST family polysaccharide transporter
MGGAAHVYRAYSFRMATVEEDSGPPRTALDGRFEGGVPPNLRSRTARGTLVNGVFLVATNALGLVKGIAVAGILSTTEYGQWGLLLAGFATLLMLGSVGIDDKYIQQDQPDQRKAFEVAFTLQCALGVVFVVVIAVGMPLFALLYGAPEIIGPGMALALAIPALALQMPLWVHYRRMDFVKQRTLQAIDPVVTLVATIALTVAGLGVWGMVIGALLGTYCATVAIVRASPYRLRFRWDRAAMREYFDFSWPLFVGAISTVLLIQVPVTVSSRTLGVTAVAGIALATQISQFTNRVDEVVTQTLYPAICAVKDRKDLLFESFWKSNRLALLWAAPLGAAAALFAGDFVHFVLGERWRFAVPLIAVYGINSALNQIGFNWTAFLRALGDTRPIAAGSTIGLVAVMAIAVPLLAAEGLTAFGIGLTAATLIGVGVRIWFLRRIFPGVAMLAHMARGIGPTIPAAAAVLAVRAIEPDSRSIAVVLGEAALFAVVAITATWLSERRLLRESIGYLRGVRSPAAAT